MANFGYEGSTAYNMVLKMTAMVDLVGTEAISKALRSIGFEKIAKNMI